MLATTTGDNLAIDVCVVPLLINCLFMPTHVASPKSSDAAVAELLLQLATTLVQSPLVYSSISSTWENSDPQSVKLPQLQVVVASVLKHYAGWTKVTAAAALLAARTAAVMAGLQQVDTSLNAWALTCWTAAAQQAVVSSATAVAGVSLLVRVGRELAQMNPDANAAPVLAALCPLLVHEASRAAPAVMAVLKAGAHIVALLRSQTSLSAAGAAAVSAITTTVQQVIDTWSSSSSLPGDATVLEALTILVLAQSNQPPHQQEILPAGQTDSTETAAGENLAQSNQRALLQALQLSSPTLPSLSLWQLYCLGRRCCVWGNFAAAQPLLAHVATYANEDRHQLWCQALCKAAAAEAAVVAGGFESAPLAASRLQEAAADLTSAASRLVPFRFQLAWLQWRAKVLQLLADVASGQSAGQAAGLADAAVGVQSQGQHLAVTALDADSTTQHLMAAMQLLCELLVHLTRGSAIGTLPAVQAGSVETDDVTFLAATPLRRAVNGLAEAVSSNTSAVPSNTSAVPDDASWAKHLRRIASATCPLPPLFFRVSQSAQLWLTLRPAAAYTGGGAGGPPGGGDRSIVRLPPGSELVVDVEGVLSGHPAPWRKQSAADTGMCEAHVQLELNWRRPGRHSPPPTSPPSPKSFSLVAEVRMEEGKKGIHEDILHLIYVSLMQMDGNYFSKRLVLDLPANTGEWELRGGCTLVDTASRVWQLPNETSLVVRVCLGGESEILMRVRKKKEWDCQPIVFFLQIEREGPPRPRPRKDTQGSVVNV